MLPINMILPYPQNQQEFIQQSGVTMLHQWASINSRNKLSFNLQLSNELQRLEILKESN